VRFAWLVLGYNIAVVLWGAYVRATGSGAGCGNNWPLCNGQVLPHSPTLNTIIEFLHRVTSGIDLALVAILVVWAFRAFPQRHPARLGAVLTAVFLVTEALIGAALVLLERVVRNASAYWHSVHLANTLTLLACLALTAWWAKGNPPLRLRGSGKWVVAATVVGVILLGISGVIAALGDTLFPARTLSEGFLQDFSSASNLFVRLRALHPLIAGMVGIVVFAVAIPRRAWWVAGLFSAQLVAGGVNMILMAPVWMQLLHLALADAFWIVLVLFLADMYKAPEPDSR